jgi:hypothetical protein
VEERARESVGGGEKEKEAEGEVEEPLFLTGS